MTFKITDESGNTVHTSDTYEEARKYVVNEWIERKSVLRIKDQDGRNYL